MFNTTTATQRKGEFYQGFLITEADISWGAKQSSTHCPICRACDLYGFENPSVGYSQVVVEVDGTEYIADLPKIATQFLQDFDAGKLVQPINFVLHFKEYKP